MYKGIRLGLICILFLSFFPFSFACHVCRSVCMVIFLCPLDCCFISMLYISCFLQRLTRYVKTRTFSLCHGKEPPLEKLSTTSVQLMPLVSPMIYFSQSVTPQHVLLESKRKSKREQLNFVPFMNTGYSESLSETFQKFQQVCLSPLIYVSAW